MLPVDQLKVKLFADGADKSQILEMYQKPYIQGFTTNPTLMRKAGITDYEAFARDILEAVPDRPVSLEVFADEIEEMRRQALKIREWGSNVYVKIPVSNTQGEPTYQLVHELSREGVQVNITALLTRQQIRCAADALRDGAASNISIFAGRIADTGVDPLPIMTEAVDLVADQPQIELIWASPRELLNVFQADCCGCHIITATSDILKKLTLVGKDLEQYSLETVQMFYADATASGYRL